MNTHSAETEKQMSRVVRICFPLLLLAVGIGGFFIGYEKGKADEAAGEIATAWLKIPLEVVTMLEDKKDTAEIQGFLERQIDCGIIAAIRFRGHCLLSQESKANIDKVLASAFSHRKDVDYVYLREESLKPSLQKEFRKAKTELTP